MGNFPFGFHVQVNRVFAVCQIGRAGTDFPVLAGNRLFIELFDELVPDAFDKAYFTYLNYNHRIQSMIYTTNWIERLQKDFRRVTRMRGAMPNEESVILLMGKTAMDKKSYLRQVPRIDLDRTLFPDE